MPKYLHNYTLFVQQTRLKSEKNGDLGKNTLFANTTYS